MKKIPEILDRMADVILAYKPKSKRKPRRKKRSAK